MTVTDIPTQHWLDITLQVTQRLFIVVVAAFIAIRFKGLRLALRGADLQWRYVPLAIMIFGLFSIMGTHSGVFVDISEGETHIDLLKDGPLVLNKNQAIASFRDTMALVAGLIAGPWVGFCAGALAGIERYHLGGFAGLASGVATPVLGLYAGLIRHFLPRWVATVNGVFWVAFTGTLIHRLMILLFVQPINLALNLSLEIVVPVAIVNCLGCVLFFWITRDLDRDRLESEANEARLLGAQAELRALRAQVYPHFLNNTLNDLNELIRTDQNKAQHYVQELADFFFYTRQFADFNTISLAEEQAQLQRYLELQRLGLGSKLHDVFQIPLELMDCQVLPGCLLTLIENALKHGFKGRRAPYQLIIGAEEHGENLLLKVSDNGRGITSEYMSELGMHPIKSEMKGGGVALYQLLRSMKMLFGDNVKISFESIPNQGTTVSLLQPKRMIS